MKLLSMTVSNFRSFRAEQTFKFPAAAGLYFMQGVNLAEPRLEANGAGKTTLWEALTWCFFGKTSRGLKAGDVCNWEAGKGTTVRVEFINSAGEECYVTRTWGPISWTLSWNQDDHVEDLTKADGNAVMGWLGLDFAPFLNCILTAQGQPMFLDIKADSKAALFSDVMGLDRWLDYSGRASKRASAQDSISRGFERELAGLHGKLEGLQGQDFTKSMEDWEEARRVKVDQLEADYEQTINDLADLQTKNKRIKEVGKVIGSEHALSVKAMREAIINRTLRLERVGDERSTMATSEANYRNAMRSRKALDQGQCPTCGQEVATRHHHISDEDLNALLRKFDEAREACDKAKQELLVAERIEHEEEGLFAESQSRLDAATYQSKDHDRSIQLAERRLDQMEETAEGLANETNPYAKLLTTARRDASRTQTSIADTQRLLDDSQHHYSLSTFWVRGFKELRLQEIGEALNELEIEVNSCVTALGLVDWELKFQVDRETKGGSIQRGFNVFVGSPHNLKPVPWESWSGGEAQRLRVAANMGLANLIRARSGCLLDLEVWDEPSNGLSQQGIRDLLEALAARARSEARVIYVVDHTAHSFGQFAGGAIITKTLTGSTLAQY